MYVNRRVRHKSPHLDMSHGGLSSSTFANTNGECVAYLSGCRSRACTKKGRLTGLVNSSYGMSRVTSASQCWLTPYKRAGLPSSTPRPLQHFNSSTRGSHNMVTPRLPLGGLVDCRHHPTLSFRGIVAEIIGIRNRELHKQSGLRSFCIRIRNNTARNEHRWDRNCVHFVARAVA